MAQTLAFPVALESWGSTVQVIWFKGDGAWEPEHIVMARMVMRSTRREQISCISYTHTRCATLYKQQKSGWVTHTMYINGLPKIRHSTRHGHRALQWHRHHQFITCIPFFLSYFFFTCKINLLNNCRKNSMSDRTPVEGFKLLKEEKTHDVGGFILLREETLEFLGLSPEFIELTLYLRVAKRECCICAANCRSSWKLSFLLNREEKGKKKKYKRRILNLYF